MTNQVIPAEAVEAAAKAACLVFNEPANARDIEYIRTILEAAAPYIRADALEEAAVAAADPSPEDMDTYFIDQADVGRWLNARAAAAAAAPYMLNNEGEK